MGHSLEDPLIMELQLKTEIPSAHFMAAFKSIDLFCCPVIMFPYKEVGIEIVLAEHLRRYRNQQYEIG
jgi:hypothetical protein